MRSLPQQLKNDNMKFILLKNRDKIPIEYAWQAKSQYSHDDIKIQEHLTRGGNIGLVCQKGNNIVIDFDNEFVENKIVPKLPATFTVKTGSGRLHKHYWCKDGENLKLLGAGKDTLVDIQADRKQVVIPPSTHPNGNDYTVLDDLPLAEISMSQIKAVFADYLPVQDRKVTQYIDRPAQVIKSKVTFERILKDYGVDVSNNPTMCPLGHSSKGGKCFHYDDLKQVAYCFHCDWGGDVISLVEEKERIDFKKALKYLSETYKIGLPENSIVTNSDGNRELNHREIADILMDKYHFLTIAEHDAVFVYKAGVYNHLGEPFIKKRVEELTEGNVKSTFTREVIESIKRRTYWSLEELETPPELIVVQNGILNVKTHQLLPHTHTLKNFVKIPVDFEPTAACPEFLKFLSEVIKPNDVHLIQEMFGYCLYREYCWQKSFMFTGSGANGKSTLLNVLKRFLGSKNVSNISIQALENERFARAELHHKLANMYNDVSSSGLVTTGTFKSLTGGDQITAERKNQQPFTFVNYAKMVFSANQIPKVNDDSDAFFRRWIIIRFEKQFIENADPTLYSRITTHEEVSGILNWALEGLARLFSQSKFSQSETTDEIREAYNRLSDPLRCFVEQCLDFDDVERFVTKESLFNAYNEYCKRNRLPRVREIRVFYKQVWDFMPNTVIEERPVLDGLRRRGLRGVSLKALEVLA